ncbi:MAG: succinylglutamate desuccinylase/aspartoacylase family protein [Bdellovibrionales bacterium]|nr:succinylglutamate desuccinylase/aspartoacylase family protein [Bdellovibrionales bacterium]
MNFIEELQKYDKKYAGPIAYSWRFPASEQNYPHLYFSTCVHGNEIGSLPAVLNFIKKLEQKIIIYPGTITLSLGNVEALKAGVRYIDHDMNRHFGDRQCQHREGQRANELCQLINECDIFVDFHQTIEPTSEPFYVIVDTIENRSFVKRLQLVKKAILRSPTHDTYLTASTYANKQHKISATIELSQIGINDQATALCAELINSTLEIAAKLKQKNNIQQLAIDLPELTWLAIAHYQKFDGPKCILKPGWANLTAVKEHQVLGKTDLGQDFLAPFNGYVLFPKYVDRDAQGTPLKPPPQDIIAITKVVE